MWFDYLELLEACGKDLRNALLCLPDRFERSTRQVYGNPEKRQLIRKKRLNEEKKQKKAKEHISRL